MSETDRIDFRDPREIEAGIINSRGYEPLNRPDERSIAELVNAGVADLLEFTPHYSDSGATNLRVIPSIEEDRTPYTRGQDLDSTSFE